MKTYKIVLSLAVAVFLVLSVVLVQAFKTERNFVVFYNQELNFCFLVDDRYSYELDKTFFRYWGGKNKGKIELLNDKLSKDLKKVNLNGFLAGYKKSKNNRHFEYELNQEYKLVDNFINASKSPVNLVPYRKECKKIMQNYKNHKEIFKERK
ncbi:MAG: hypothetical protein QF441_10290 [Bacteriovoracaceae bacterium]|jgi:hypothetical protein|nr:hypothetical protein [Halobacteriovoraceae bacterium]MDP7320988.1 hypothetical protein [Bacteriovoracaceae bacterium]